MANIILSRIDYGQASSLAGIPAISLIQNKANRQIEFNIELSERLAEIQAIKLIVAYFKKDESLIEKKAHLFQGEQLKKNEDGTYAFSIELSPDAEFGGVYIASIIDNQLETYHDLGMYSFATKQRIAEEVRRLYDGEQLSPYYFEVEPHPKTAGLPLQDIPSMGALPNEPAEAPQQDVLKIKEDDGKMGKGLMITTIVCAVMAVLFVLVTIILLLIDINMG